MRSYPAVPAKASSRLLNADAGANGGLDPATDLVLVDQTFTSDANTLVCYASVNMGTDVTVHSLTINGQTIPAGRYLTSDPSMANYLIANSSTVARTLTVLTPTVPPAAVTDLAAGDPQLDVCHAYLVGAMGRARPGQLRHPLQHRADHEQQFRRYHGRRTEPDAQGTGPGREPAGHRPDASHHVLLRNQVDQYLQPCKRSVEHRHSGYVDP